MNTSSSKIAFFCLSMSFLFHHNVSDAQIQVAQERIIMSTSQGNLVLALYPDVAPNHVAQIMHLVELGAYDSTYFFRIEPGFIIQLTDVKNRMNPATREQRNADNKIKAEFSNTIKHTKGMLSMARWDDKDSATSSFSILLNDAPHLDGQYTIFGFLESGGSVVNKIISGERQGTKPVNPVQIIKAWIEKDIDSYYVKYPRDPADVISSVRLIDVKSEGIKNGEESQLQVILLYLIAAMILISTLAYLFFSKLTKSRLLTLHLLNMLIGGFVLFIIIIPVGHDVPVIAALVFIGLFAMFRAMSRFENK